MFIFTLSIFILLALQVVLLYCLWRGPSYPDRLVVLNAIASKTNMLVILVGFLFGKIDMFVDIALAFALLSFVTTLALSRFLERTQGV